MGYLMLEWLLIVSASDVLDSLNAVKLGKATGINGLSAEHFVCAHTRVHVYLSLLFTFNEVSLKNVLLR